MSEETRLWLYALVCAVGLGALYLWIKDRLYVDRTGKPAAERVREWSERRLRPMSKRAYVAYSLLDMVVCALLLVDIVFALRHHARLDVLVPPLCLAVYFAAHQYELKKKQTRQLPGSAM